MQVSCPNMAILKNQPLSRKPLPIEQKHAQFRRPGIERECMSLLLELWAMAKLVVKQSAKAHGPLVSTCIAIACTLHTILMFVSMMSVIRCIMYIYIYVLSVKILIEVTYKP